MSTEQEIQIEDLSNDKSYFTQIPNIIYRMGLGPYVIAYYSILKSIAGDRATCFMSQKNLALLVGCSDKQISLMNKFMSKPFEILNGKSLIRLKTQKKNGEYLPNIIQVVDIWSENMSVIGSKKTIPNTPMPKKVSKFKKNIPSEPSSPPREPGSPPREPGSDKEETIEEDLSNNNDINVNLDRSSYICDSIVSFDASTYVLPNGKNLSLQMQRSIAKYSEDELYKLRSNIAYFEDQVKKGIKPNDTYEKWLQACIKYDYASKQNNSDQNKLYATFIKEEYKLSNLTILKTVLQMRKNAIEPPHSISFSLPVKTFTDALDNFIKNNKD